MFTVQFKVHELQSRRRAAVTVVASFLPQRRQLRLADKAVLVRIQPVEEGGGEFVAAEFAIVVDVALL
jgi:hypothetical protein